MVSKLFYKLKETPILQFLDLNVLERPKTEDLAK